MPNENEIISAFVDILGHPGRGYSEIGDDVAYLSLKDRKIVAKCDMLVRKTDVPPQMESWQIARKAVVSVVSDFSAKGVRPLAFMFSLGIPRTTTMNEIRELAVGFARARDEFNIRFIGGDTNECDDLVIDCVLLGYGRKLIERRGARPRDLVAVTGPFGYTSAGISILTKGLRGKSDFVRRAKSSALMPKPRLHLGLALAEKGLMTSSIDSSDGLSISLYELAERGNVRVVLEDAPGGPGLKEFCTANRLNYEDLVLKGGEEYEIVFTIGEERLEEAQKVARLHGSEIKRIGRIIEGSPRVEFRGRVLEREGWVHLR